MELSRRHHEEQKLIARNVVAELDPIWQILKFHDLNKSTGPWLKAARPIIERGYLTSQYVAAEFVKNFRAENFPGEEPLDVEVPNPLGAFGFHPRPDRDTAIRIMVSMKVTGPVWVMQNSQREWTDEQQIAQVMRDGFSKSTGAAIRLVLNGGRGMVRMMVGADRLARGVVGVADADACTSCQFLTRPVMKSDGVRKMNAVVVGHDFCTCSANPVY